MEVLLFILLVACVALCSYIAYVVHGMTSEKALPSAKVTAALEERVSMIMSSLNDDEWKRVAAGDTSILVAKSVHVRVDDDIRDGLVSRLKEIEKNLAIATQKYTTASSKGYAYDASVAQDAMRHLNSEAATARKELAKFGK